MFSNRVIRCPLYDFILCTCGFKWRSTSWEIFSVGPPHPLTMGLTAIGFLCIFLRKCNCCVLGGDEVFFSGYVNDTFLEHCFYVGVDSLC